MPTATTDPPVRVEARRDDGALLLSYAGGPTALLVGRDGRWLTTLGAAYARGDWEPADEAAPAGLLTDHDIAMLEQAARETPPARPLTGPQSTPPRPVRPRPAVKLTRPAARLTYTRPPPPADMSVGSFVAWGDQRGRVDLIVKHGQVPHAEGDQPTPASPVARVLLWQPTPGGGWARTGRRVAVKAAALRIISPPGPPGGEPQARLVALAAAHADHGEPAPGAVRAVYGRGLLAWPGPCSGHTREEWALARAAAFLRKAAGGRSSGGYHRDDDLLHTPTQARLQMVRPRSRLAVKAKGWDPRQHPRDKNGRFARVGAAVELPGGQTGRIRRVLDGGKVEVARDTGGHTTVDARTVTVREDSPAAKPTEPASAGGTAKPAGPAVVEARHIGEEHIGQTVTDPVGGASGTLAEVRHRKNTILVFRDGGQIVVSPDRKIQVGGPAKKPPAPAPKPRAAPAKAPRNLNYANPLAEDDAFGAVWNPLQADDQLTSDQHNALTKYIGSDYTPVNELLRHGGDSDPALREEIKQITQAFAEAPELSRPISVHRGLQGDPARLFGPVGSTVGGEFVDKSFVSTTTRPLAGTTRSSENYHYEGSRTVMNIAIPAGSKVMGMGRAEREVLLPAGARFVVTGDTESDGKRIIDLRYVPGEAA